MVHHRRDKPQPVVRLAEAGIVRPAQKLRERFAVTVGGELIAPFIEGHAEGVHLPVREMLDSRAVQLHAVGIARLHR